MVVDNLLHTTKGVRCGHLLLCTREGTYYRPMLRAFPCSFLGVSETLRLHGTVAFFSIGAFAGSGYFSGGFFGAM